MFPQGRRSVHRDARARAGTDPGQGDRGRQSHHPGFRGREDPGAQRPLRPVRHRQAKNARVPKDRDPKTLTLEECQALLAAAPAKGSPRPLRPQAPREGAAMGRLRRAADSRRARRRPRPASAAPTQPKTPGKGRAQLKTEQAKPPAEGRAARPRQRPRRAAAARSCGTKAHRARGGARSAARMKYRHSFHAGNFADVHKHVTLLALIAALQRKDKGFLYLETHAGRGLLRAATAPTPTRAPRRASASARCRARHPRSPQIRAYLRRVARFRLECGSPSAYPARRCSRRSRCAPQDRGSCCEIQPSECRALERALHT